ncbi:nitroreductase [Salinisphaera dokdonensis CL-ES53]|uniref:Nitroreductase n=1 Tax=Salinisphaera dokdonensis CL-ES53 TaxID=1304272 RepID=A0ABV2AYP6_9GAMM
MSKNAATDHRIHNTLAVRWSPYAFSDRPVPAADLASLFEAARWAPSSYNEQPWRYIVGVKGAGSTHERIVECLAEGNRAWAQNAPVLALGVVIRNFVKNGKPNKAAEHDLGLASANLVTEATTRKLHVHQMIGLDPEAARTVFGVPEEAEVFTALAIGYREVSAHMNEALTERDTKPRARRPLDEFVFTEQFGTPIRF